MPARDTDHETVKRALVEDGWTITHDPYVLMIGGDKVFVDLGAERPIAAEKDGQKIAVEVKSFRGRSTNNDFQHAVGQYFQYLSLIRRIEPDRLLFLAISEDVYEAINDSAIMRPALEDSKIPLVVFRPNEERISRWIR